MQCPICFLRYNAKQRQPKVISCGHTICQNCIKKTDKCRICATELIPDKNYALNFSLMQIIEKDSKQIDKYVKVCFVGSSTTGKTSLIKRMMGSEFCQETVTTIGYDFSFQDRVIDNLQIRYQLWDSAGQQKYRAISPIHYKNADIAVIVYDVAQSASDNKISDWIDQAMKNCSQDVRFIIIGNKIDLAEQNKMFKPIDQKGWNLIEQNHYIHIQLSCKTFFGIKQFWDTLDQQFRKKLSAKKKNIASYEKQLQNIQKKRETMTKIKKNSKIDRNHFNTQNRNDSCC